MATHMNLSESKSRDSVDNFSVEKLREVKKRSSKSNKAARGIPIELKTAKNMATRLTLKKAPLTQVSCASKFLLFYFIKFLN